MKGIRIAIYHFAPLEYYPPVQNMINAISSGLAPHDKVVVYTTAAKKGELLFRINNKNVRIIRTGNFSFGRSAFERYSTYLMHYLKSFFGTIVFRPRKLLYYETISSFVPVLYKSIIKRKSDLYIHYHEYMSPAEYNSMFLNRLFLKWEKKIYPSAKWISHTNNDRLEMFAKDIGYSEKENMFELPNYPPSVWNSNRKETDSRLPLKLVYVGSFGSLETIYIREIIDWVSAYSQELSLDIFSNNITPEVQGWIDLKPRPGIYIRGNIPYVELQDLLPGYDVGLILYKGANANFIYNAPNKLFEYLVCGLEVWYPGEMLGVYPYDCIDQRPRVIRLDFKKLDGDILKLAEQATGLTDREINYKFEVIASPLINSILERQNY